MDGQMLDDVRPAVASSWVRCAKNKVDPMNAAGRLAGEGMTSSIAQANVSLRNIALPMMEGVSNAILGEHSVIALTDNCGHILETTGNPIAIRRANALNFQRGALWSCDEVGTNAVGMALELGCPMQIVGSEHFCKPLHGVACSASPIHGTNGEIIGCIGVLREAGGVGMSSLGMACSLAMAIESAILQRQDAMTMRAVLENSSNSILLLDDACRCVWMNGRATDLLGASRSSLIGLDMREVLMDIDWERAGRGVPAGASERVECRMRVGDQTLDCFAEVTRVRDEHGVGGYTVSINRLESIIEGINLLGENRAYLSFDEFEPLDRLDPRMSRSVRMARTYARYDGCIMMECERGAGGEILAQAIHNGSRRASRPFVTVDCTMIPRNMIEVELFGCEKDSFPGVRGGPIPGKFEIAGGGTIFLFEIGEVSIEIQRKLVSLIRDSRALRVGGRHYRPLDVRVITSTSRDIRRDVQKNVFSRELYGLLSSLKIEIPPLRERGPDIGRLARMFLDRCNARYPDRKKILAPDAIRALEEYPWPGNVRELLTCMEQAFFMTIDDRSDDVPGSVIREVIASRPEGKLLSEPSAPRPDTYEQFERNNIETALERHRGDVERTAGALDISRASLYRKMKNFGIRAKDYRDPGRKKD
jgi:transcriptional regulator of acetoin/glycerol metabolism